jgi:hypothetical protein
MTHTPGPWTYAKGSIRGPDDAFIVPDSPYTSEADARLIAAAPDLLAALEKFPSWGGPIDAAEDYDLLIRGEWLLLARAAIAKARGES